MRVWRCQWCRRSFYERYGNAFYDLKTPEPQVERALRRSREGLGPEAGARVEAVHPPTGQRWIARASAPAQAADQALITQVQTDNVELAELNSFAGAQHPDPAQGVADERGRQWPHCALARESRLLLEVVVGPRTQESAPQLVEGAARRLAPGRRTPRDQARLRQAAHELEQSERGEAAVGDKDQRAQASGDRALAQGQERADQQRLRLIPHGLGKKGVKLYDQRQPFGGPRGPNGDLSWKRCLQLTRPADCVSKLRNG